MQYPDRKLRIVKPQIQLPEFSRNPKPQADYGLQTECDQLRSRLAGEIREHMKAINENIAFIDQLKAEKVSHGSTLHEFWLYRQKAKQHFIAIALFGCAVGWLAGIAYGLADSKTSIVPTRQPVQSFMEESGK
jgi:hypothetical protein